MKGRLFEVVWYQNKRNLIKLFQVCSSEFNITRKNLEKLIILEFTSNSAHFHKKIVSKIYILCETYLNRKNITDVEFREYTVNLLVEIQSYN